MAFSSPEEILSTPKNSSTGSSYCGMSDLAEFEQKYQQSSTEFYRQFQAGETGDGMDYVEWASLVQMADNLHKRLRLLTGEADA
jgi:hypothetical protein